MSTDTVVTPSKAAEKSNNAYVNGPRHMPEIQARRIITGHDANGKGIIQVVDEGNWQSIAGGTSAYNVMWATRTSPVDIANDETLEREITTGSLSMANGTVLRIVERAPHSQGPMHRTQSLDYGIVIDGEMELVMDSGDRMVLKKGDVCIQRATMHQWNNNTDKWNRMVFVLMDALPLEVAGQTYAGEVGLDHIKEISRRS
jgi:quercetin dioxygenase-like cupin family protein